jgi:hypothetical protein
MRLSFAPLLALLLAPVLAASAASIKAQRWALRAHKTPDNVLSLDSASFDELVAREGRDYSVSLLLTALDPGFKVRCFLRVVLDQEALLQCVTSPPAVPADHSALLVDLPFAARPRRSSVCSLRVSRICFDVAGPRRLLLLTLGAVRPRSTFDPTYRAVAKSWGRLPKEQREKHLFVSVDYAKGPEIFRKVSLVHRTLPPEARK